MPSNRKPILILVSVFMLGIVAVFSLMQSITVIEAQAPAIEVSCPAGATAIPQMTVIAPSGKIRQLACMDASGSILFPSTTSSTFGWSGTTLTVGQSGIASGSIQIIGAGAGANLSASPTTNLGSNTLGWSGSGLSVSGIVSSGAFSLTGTGACSTLTPSGESWNGGATCTGTTGAATLVLTPGTTAPHFWNCNGADTTSGHLLNGTQLGVSSTTCTLSFTSVTNNDVVTISAFAF